MSNLGFGRFIGKKSLPEGSDNSGLWKLGAQYYLRTLNRWFSNDYSISPNTTNINEGGSVTFTATTVGVPNGTTVYYTVSGTVSASDFTSGSLSGSFTINSNTGSITFVASTDYVTEGSESFQVQLRTGSTSGPIVATSSTVTINDTTLTPTYTITPSDTTVNEGASVTFAISTTNVPNGTTLYYTLNSVSGSVNSSDFTSGSLSGSVIVSGSSASISYTLANDLTNNEGNESFQIRLRTGSISGTIVATSPTVTISDSSALTYAVSPSTTSITEGQSVTFNVNTLGISNGTTLYWSISTVSGTIENDDFSSPANAVTNGGSFTINSNTGSFVLTTSTSATRETNDSFQIRIRTGSTTGTIVATSSTVTINEPAVSITTSGAITSDIGGYRYHVFTFPGSITINSTSEISVDYLVVGGGGNGIYFNASGGGGAGGFRSGTGLPLTGPAQYFATIGAGGAQFPGAGNPTRFFTILTNGGAVAFQGTSGGSAGGSGSGGGHSANLFNQTETFPGSSGNLGGFTPPEGRPGGTGYWYSSPTLYGGYYGGGGGAGGQGGNGSSGSSGGNGGSGSYSPIGAAVGYGSPTGYFAGGGGGWGGGTRIPYSPYTLAYPGSGGSGGIGGGGRGGSAIYKQYLTPPADGPGGTVPNPFYRDATAGAQNTGGGGGGAMPASGGQEPYPGGIYGGSGIVIIRYLWPV